MKNTEFYAILDSVDEKASEAYKYQMVVNRQNAVNYTPLGHMLKQGWYPTTVLRRSFVFNDSKKGKDYWWKIHDALMAKGK